MGFIFKKTDRRSNAPAPKANAGQVHVQHQQEFLKAVLDNVADGIVACDANGTLTLFNDATRKLHGIPELPLPPSKWSSYYSLFEPDGKTPLPMNKIPLLLALENGSVTDVEIVIAPKGQKPRTVLCNGRALHDASGLKLGAVISMHDITDQNTKEQELAQSKTFLRTIIDAVADPIFVKNREHKWVEGNTAFWNLIGPEDTIKGRTDYDIFPKDEADKFWEGDEKVFNGEMFNEEEKLSTKTGEQLTIATKKVPFMLMDGTQGLVGVIRDVTKQRKLEQELRDHRDHLEDMVAQQTQDLTKQMERAESANIAKTDFLANMSHEIRTPMNAIIGLASILSSTPLTDNQKKYIETLQTSAGSLLDLINDLLDISKIEANTVELETVPFNIIDLTKEVIILMSLRTEEKKLSLTLDTAMDIVQAPHFKGDPARLRQVLLNLVSNAVKFTDTGYVQISIERAGSNISIKIKDSGIGIASNKLDTIFDKFVQGDSSISRKYGGTGLGLAITKTLVSVMGGTIEVTSKPKEGSTFIVTLPLATADAPEKSTGHDAATSDAQVSTSTEQLILLVEDYAPNALVAGTFLEQFGFKYDIATNGLEAVSKAQIYTYTAILMDVQMPGMDGLTATRYIREFESKLGKPRTPIIGMTAYALSEDRDRCLSAGMDFYISKPFTRNDLEEILRSIIPDKK